MLTNSKRLPTGPINVNILDNIHLSPNAPNTITVFWRNDFHKRLVISAYLVDELTFSQLLQRMKANRIRSKGFTSALSMLHVLFIFYLSFFTNILNVNNNSSSFYLVEEKFRDDGDCEIAATDLRESLMCPFVSNRLEL